jgi:anti-anti-sigma factor
LPGEALAKALFEALPDTLATVHERAGFDFLAALPGGAEVTGMDSNETMTVEIDHHGVLVVHGDIDIAGGPILDAAIVAHELEHPLVIDLGDVFFIDSSGLRSLLSASRRSQTRGTGVVLRSVGSEVARLLQITGTADQFIIESSRD